VTRRAAVIKQTRSKASNVILVDAGNSLIMSDSGPKEPAEATHGQTSVEILNRLGYDAVGLGDKDLILSKADLTKRMSEAQGFSFLSANLIDKATNHLFAKPYDIKAVAGHRVAFIGITGAVPENSADWSLVPPIDAAREYVRKLQPQADIIILLSTAGADMNQQIAAQVPGIDVIVSGGDQPLAQPAEPAPGTIVVQSETSIPGEAGRFIGRLTVDYDAAGKMTGQKWEDIQLTPGIGDDPDMQKWVSSLSQS